MSGLVFPDVSQFVVKSVPIWARMFGERFRVEECGHWVHFIKWRGKVYVLDTGTVPQCPCLDCTRRRSVEPAGGGA